MGRDHCLDSWIGRDAGDDLLSTNQSCLLHVSPGREVFKPDRFWPLAWVVFFFPLVCCFGFCCLFGGFLFGYVLVWFRCLFGWLCFYFCGEFVLDDWSFPPYLPVC